MHGHTNIKIISKFVLDSSRVYVVTIKDHCTNLLLLYISVRMRFVVNKLIFVYTLHRMCTVLR